MFRSRDIYIFVLFWNTQIFKNCDIIIGITSSGTSTSKMKLDIIGYWVTETGS